MWFAGRLGLRGVCAAGLEAETVDAEGGEARCCAAGGGRGECQAGPAALPPDCEHELRHLL